jgi:hypothetical protein
MISFSHIRDFRFSKKLYTHRHGDRERSAAGGDPVDGADYFWMATRRASLAVAMTMGEMCLMKIDSPIIGGLLKSFI